MADCDLILSMEALTELAEGVRAWCPVVPDYRDMEDAAKELIYLLASVRVRTARLEDVMHGRFYPAFPDLDAVGDTDRPVIEAILRPLGVNQIKARNIVGIIHRFHTRGLRFDDEAMRRLDRQGELWTFLETLPGVGAKLIECLRVFSFAYPGVPLDTHNWRVMWRFGVLWPDFVGKPVELTALKKRQAHLALRRIVPNGEGKALHNRLMRLGIEICTARNPKCETCPLAKQCLRRGLAPA